MERNGAIVAKEEVWEMWDQDDRGGGAAQFAHCILDDDPEQLTVLSEMISEMVMNRC